MNLTGKERRITSRLLNYWEKIRAGRVLPAESDINPDDPDIADFWDHCFLMHTRDISAADGNYMYLGTAIQRAFSGHLSTELHQGIISPNHRALEQRFSGVIELKMPILQEDEFKDIYGARVLYRQCMLPLGEKGDVVDGIFGCMSFKITI